MSRLRGLGDTLLKKHEWRMRNAAFCVKKGGPWEFIFVCVYTAYRNSGSILNNPVWVLSVKWV